MSTRPNILIIVVDSMRADHVGCYGYGRDTTPHIDKLAAEGCLFERAITPAPFSPAAYASLFSNLYPHQHGVNGDTVRVWPDAWPRLPETMREHGYDTFGISNNAFVTCAMNAERGFDEFIDMRASGWLSRQQNRIFRRIRMHLGESVAKRLSNRVHCSVKGDSSYSIEQAGRMIRHADRPFFGFLILMDPHTPYDKRHVAFVRDRAAARRFFSERNDRTMWAEMMADRAALTQRELGVVHDLYDSAILHADACVGTLMHALADAGKLDDTIVAVTADHGEAFGERGVWGHGFCLNDCLTRVPLIVRHPHYFASCSRFAGLVQFHDLHDLCLGVAAGGEPDVDACPNCLARFSDPDWMGRDAVYSEFPRQSKTLDFMSRRNPSLDPGIWNQGMWTVRTRDWRYIWYEDGTFELYDLNADPAETASVHEEHPETCAELDGLLEAHRADGGAITTATRTPPETEEAVSERLRALGYID